MVCENCGQTLKTLTTFCPYCGTLVKSVEKPILAPLPGQNMPVKIEENEADTNSQSSVNDNPVNNNESRGNFANGIVQNNLNGGSANNASQNVPMQNAPAVSPYSYGMEGAISQPVKKDNSWAGTVSLIMGILSVLSCGAGTLVVILAIVFGVIGLKTSKRKLAIAGIVLSVISVIIFIALVAMAFVGFWSAMPLIDEAAMEGIFQL